MEDVEFIVHAVSYKDDKIADYKVRPVMDAIVGEFSMTGSRMWLSHYLDKGEPRFYVLADDMGKEVKGAEVRLNSNGFIRIDKLDEACDWLGDF